MGFELEEDEITIQDLIKREFGSNEFKAGYTRGVFRFHGQLKAKDAKEHFKRMKEVME